MKMTRKRALKIGNWHASPTLEDAFWKAFGVIAVRQGRSRSRLAREIASRIFPGQPLSGRHLSSAVRIFVLQNVQEQVREGDKYAAELRDTIKELILGTEEATDGLAPIAAVIAGARANA